MRLTKLATDGIMGYDVLPNHRVFIDNRANTTYFGLSGG